MWFLEIGGDPHIRRASRGPRLTPLHQNDNHVFALKNAGDFPGKQEIDSGRQLDPDASTLQSSKSLGFMLYLRGAGKRKKARK
jgi:hypothetical protein